MTLIVLVGATLGTVNAGSSAFLIVLGFAGASFVDTVIDALRVRRASTHRHLVDAR